MFQVILETEMAEQRQEIFAHHPAHHVAGRELPGLFVGIGNEHLAHQPPVGAVRLAAGFRSARLHRFPVAADIGRVEVEAHRDEAALARKLQRVGALGKPRHADRRMRRLLRLDVRLEEIEHRLGLVDRPELALVGPGRVLGPHFQDDLQRLARHVAVLAGHAVDIEHRPVAGKPAGGDAKIQAAVGEMVEHSDAVGELRRVVIGQQESAGAEADVLGLQERLRQQQIRRRVRLPGRGVVLADPGFLITEFIQPAQDLQVPVVTLLQSALRRMRGHREISKFHGNFPLALLMGASCARKREYPPWLRRNHDWCGAAREVPRGDLARSERRRAEQRLLRRRLRTPVLRRCRNFAAEFGRSVPAPARIVEHAAGQRDHVGLAGRHDLLGLLRFGDQADRHGDEAGGFLDRLRERYLVAGAERYQ
ncbi:hypothetical protein ES703_121234 [subsurface metagenome]